MQFIFRVTPSDLAFIRPPIYHGVRCNMRYPHAARSMLAREASPCLMLSTFCSAPPSWVAAFSMPKPATACEATAMTLDYALGAIVTIGLLIYLVYALIRPEKF